MYEVSISHNLTNDEFLKSNASSQWSFCPNLSIIGKTHPTLLHFSKGSFFKIPFRTIRQVDPNFTQDNFVRFLEKEMIPIVLEAAAMNDQEVVEDWALDAPSQKLLLSHNAAKKGL